MPWPCSLSRCAFGLLLMLSTLSATASTLNVDGYRKVLQHGVDTGVYRQLAVGWIDAGTRHTWFYGRRAQPTAQSQFEIGSVTEVFTGLLLAEAAFQGQLRLDSSLSRFMPQGITLADQTLSNATLRDLAIHRAGLPVLPPNLFPTRMDDPYADYDSDDLLRLLVNWHTAKHPATTQYSPLDAGLLGFILARQLAEPYPILLHDKVLTPLGLSRTGFADSAQLLTGYSAGKPVAHWHYRALDASAGLRSSLGDMLDFLQVNLRPADSPLRAALLLARRGYAKHGAVDYGLGWRAVASTSSDNAWPVVWSASRTGGFSVFVGYRSDDQQALALLGNTDADLGALGLAWLRHDAPPPAPAVSAHPASLKLDDYTGLYEVGEDVQLIIRDESGALTAQWSGQPVLELQAVSTDTFDTGDAGYTLSFQREAGRVISVLISHDGINVPAKRLSLRAPRLRRIPIALTAQELDAAVGDYRVDNHTLLRIAADGVALDLQLTARKRMPLTAYAPDHFVTMDDAIDLVLQRRRDGSVAAVDLELAGKRRVAPRVVWQIRRTATATTVPPKH